MVFSSYPIENDIMFNIKIPPMFIGYDSNHNIGNGEDGLCMNVKLELGP
jgi:hypothetical protein